MLVAVYKLFPCVGRWSSSSHALSALTPLTFRKLILPPAVESQAIQTLLIACVHSVCKGLDPQYLAVTHP